MLSKVAGVFYVLKLRLFAVNRQPTFYAQPSGANSALVLILLAIISVLASFTRSKVFVGFEYGIES